MSRCLVSILRSVRRPAVALVATAALAVSAHGAARAASLLTESFNGTQPGSAYSGSIGGSAFAVTSGTADIIGSIANGAGSTFYDCPGSIGSANNCLDLNGNGPGSITSSSRFDLRAGTTYTLRFDLAGSVADPGGAPFTMQVTLGDSAAYRFSVPAGGNFGTEQIRYTPTTDQSAASLVFTSTTAHASPEYGPLIDNIVLSDAPSAPGVAISGSDILFSQDFSDATPAPNYAGAVSATGFTTTLGSVDIIGDLPNLGSGFYTCPFGAVGSNNCLDLNGSGPGAIISDQVFSLLAGVTYQIGFDMAGSVDDGNHDVYGLHVALGDSGDVAFTADAGSPFSRRTFNYTPVQNQTDARLTLTSDSNTANPQYGPLIDNIVIRIAPLSQNNEPAAVPEPASFAVLGVGLLALARLRRRRGGT